MSLLSCLIVIYEPVSDSIWPAGGWGVYKVSQIPIKWKIKLKLVLHGLPWETCLFAHCAISILVHVLENFLQGGFFAHKFSERKTTIIVSVHPVEKFRDFVPNGRRGMKRSFKLFLSKSDKSDLEKDIWYILFMIQL